ncbi:MAG: ribonuclease H-like domain-containing protein, partial [Candidatus Aenigmarchaeota archaeon]|nr:ribonuclease H-like domain-containing protein [Candidatus Aenigmarchaeota archaeon]
VLTTDFEPYFYIIPKSDPKSIQKEIASLKLQDSEGHPITIKRTDIQKKTVDGKDISVIKIIANTSKDVPKLKDAIKHMDFVKDKREYDIPFAKRYLFDRDIRPMSWLKVKGKEIKSNYNCDTTIVAETIEKEENKTFPNLNILAFDLETIPLANNRQQIIMASLASNKGLKRVLTYQKATQKDTIIKESEKELIEQLIQDIQNEKPDFIVTYNGDAFDFTVLKDRADHYKISLNLGFNTRPIQFLRRGMTNAAMIKGSAHIDLYQFIFKVMRTTLKSETLTLDNVASELIGEKKLDMDFEEMQQLWKDREDLKTIAEYNLHDSVITLKLAEYILPNIFAMCHLTNQIPSDAGRSTYGQLVESFAMKNAARLNTIVPNRPSSDTISDRKRIDAIEGAFVVEPEPGLYTDIAVLDFKSLYPSIIVSHNISPETLN